MRFPRKIPARRRLAIAALAVGLVGAAGPAVAAPPASAVAGLQIVSAQTAAGSLSFNPLFVRCPAGTHGLSGDVQISGGTQFRIYTIQPASTGVQFVVTEPEQGFAGNWSYTGRAICAPTASLPGLEYVWGDGKVDVLARGEPVRTEAWAECPEAKGAIGMGAWVSATDSTGSEQEPTVENKTHLTAIRAIGVPGRHADYVRSSVSAAGYEGSVRVVAFAVCVNLRQVPSLLWVEGDQTASNSTGDKQARASCPAGTALHGAGFLMDYQISDGTGAHLGATQVRFGSGLVDVVGRESAAGTPNNWSLFATVLCA
jgi:hypothetical protein